MEIFRRRSSSVGWPVMMCFSVSPSRNAMAINAWPPSSPMSWMVQMLGRGQWQVNERNSRMELTNGTHVDSWEEELAPDEPLFGVVNHRLAGRAASEATHDRGTTARLCHPTPGIRNQ